VNLGERFIFRLFRGGGGLEMTRMDLCLVVPLTLLATGIAESPVFPADDKNGKSPSVVYDSDMAFQDLDEVDRLIRKKKLKSAETLLNEIKMKSNYDRFMSTPESLNREIRYYETLLQDRAGHGRWNVVQGWVTRIDQGPAYILIDLKGKGTYNIGSRLLESKGLDLLEEGSPVTVWYDEAPEMNQVVRIIVHEQSKI